MLVQGFCPPNIRITLFPDGFRRKVYVQQSKIPFSASLLKLKIIVNEQNEKVI